MPTLNHAVDRLTPLQGWRTNARGHLRLLDCSLIVATYKRSEEARDLIVCLIGLKEIPAEVVVVDGSPESDTEKELLEISASVDLPFDLVYVRSPKGLTLQRNIGIDISTKQFLFFLDDDARPLDAYFRKIRDVFLQEPTIAAVGGCAVNEMDKPMPRRWRIRRALRLVPRTDPFIYNDAGTSAPTGLLKPFSGIRDVDIFPGYAFAIRRTVCDSMRFSGFFDGYSYGEDVEMALRIRQKARVVSCGDARVIHRPSPGGRPAAFEKGRMEVRNRYFIWWRYSKNASFLNKIRFHLDFLFLFFMDLAWFIARPWRAHYLSHALGVLSGIVTCALSAPEWNEPEAIPCYRLAVANTFEQGSHAGN